MQTKLQVRQVSDRAAMQTDSGVATVWLALYLIILVALAFRPAVSDALALAGLY